MDVSSYSVLCIFTIVSRLDIIIIAVIRLDIIIIITITILMFNIIIVIIIVTTLDITITLLTVKVSKGKRISEVGVVLTLRALLSRQKVQSEKILIKKNLKNSKCQGPAQWGKNGYDI